MERLEAVISRLPGAVVATDANANLAGYGLGRHGWIASDLEPDADEERWQEIIEWIGTSYTLVAPRTLARPVHPDPEP